MQANAERGEDTKMSVDVETENEPALDGVVDGSAESSSGTLVDADSDVDPTLSVSCRPSTRKRASAGVSSGSRRSPWSSGW